MLLRHTRLSEVKAVWKDIKMLAALTGEGMTDGERRRDERCPLCDGGATKEKAFSLFRRSNTVFFKCFRASCGIHGSVDVYGTLGDRQDSLVPKTVDMRRLFDAPLLPLPSEQARFLNTKYSLSADELEQAGVKYSPNDGRMAYSVFGPGGHLQFRGFNVRSYQPAHIKWDAYREQWETPWIGWYERAYIGSDSPVLVVEDQISAIKASRVYLSVALLGTHLDLEKVSEIGRKAGQRVVLLALDKDATAKAIDYVNEFKFFTNDRFVAIPLEADIKAMSTTELNTLVKRYSCD